MHDHVTPAMQALHWLPINFYIQLKLCILMHAAVNDRRTEYINIFLVKILTLPRCKRQYS